MSPDNNNYFISSKHAKMLARQAEIILTGRFQVDLAAFSGIIMTQAPGSYYAAATVGFPTAREI